MCIGAVKERNNTRFRSPFSNDIIGIQERRMIKSMGLIAGVLVISMSGSAVAQTIVSACRHPKTSTNSDIAPCPT
jgi:hypothetical protein